MSDLSDVLSTNFDYPTPTPLQKAIIVFLESKLSGARLIEHLRKLDLGRPEEYFSPEVVTKSGKSIRDYTIDLVRRRTSPSGVWSAVIPAQYAGKIALHEIVGGLGIVPKCIYVRQSNVLKAAAELYAELRVNLNESEDLQAKPSLTMPDLVTMRGYIAQAATQRAALARNMSRIGADVLEVESTDFVTDPEPVLALISGFLKVDPSAAKSLSDSNPVSRAHGDVSRIVNSVVEHATAMSRGYLVTMQRELKELKRGAPEDPKRVAVVMMVKDEEDIIFSNLVWHFAIGLRQFLILDNLSTDNTRAEIARFSRICEPLGARVVVVDDREVGYYQSRKTTSAAHMASSYFGAEWILALDADELLFAPKGDIFSILSRGETEMERELGLSRNDPLFLASLNFPLVDHFCTATDRAAEPNPIVRLPFRRRKPKGGFKNGALWSPDLKFGQGNHKVGIAGGGTIPALNAGPMGAQIRHFPVRSFEHFVRKVRNGGLAYLNATGLGSSGYHWKTLYQILQNDGEAGLQKIFDDTYMINPTEMQHDPLPAVVIERERVFLEKQAPDRGLLLDISIHGEKVVSVGGVNFKPDMISINVPPVPKPVFVRINTSDVPTFLQIFARREYDIVFPDTPEYILDLGANIGLATAYFLGRFPEAKVVCVEPNEENYRVLLKNLSGYPGVSALHAAVWPEEGRLEVVETDGGGNPLGFWGTQTRAFLTSPPADRVVGVPAITIGEIMRRHNFPRIDLLKVDIEGAELELFSRNTDEWLPLVEYLVVETHDRFRPGSTAAVQAAMAHFEFNQERSGENLVFIKRKPKHSPETVGVVSAAAT